MRNCAFVFAALLWGAFAAAGQTISLDQNWELLPDPDAKYTLQTLPQDGWRPVHVGISWNSQFEDMRDFGGVGWYKTSFNLSDLSDSHVSLHFAACDYFCEVFVNRNKIGQHEGGYTPFDVDVRLGGGPGKNQLIVRVSDPPRDEKRNKQILPQFIYDEVPHGKQNWYVQTGGLWQPVALTKTPPIAMTGIHVSAALDGKVAIDIPMRAIGESIAKNRGQAHLEVRSAQIVIRAPDGRIVAESKFPAAYGEHIFGGSSAGTSHVSLTIRNPRPWSPDTPDLYTARALVVLSNGVTQSQAVRFGFRALTTREGKLYLNGKPFYMIGALDQDFYPATIYTPPSPEYIRAEMRKGKALGLNTLRCHIKVCTPDYLDAADEVGMLIWYEIPSWNDERHWTQQAADRGMQVFREALERDWNHPSLAIQSIINESWGADLSKPEQRKWLASAYDDARKAVAPLGRLLDDNSACCENFHVKSDLADFHQYYSIPDHGEQWSKWVADFGARPRWIWSSHDDAQPTGNEPLIVSEFGNWGLPKLPCELESSRSSDDQTIRPSDCPWWFSRDFNGREITMPVGVVERFHQYKLDRIFRSYNELAEATEWHQFESLKYEIEKIRSHPSIQGYVITEFTDLNWESNGLLDMMRNEKTYAKDLAQIQQLDVVLTPSDQNVTAGNPAILIPRWSHRSPSSLSDATLQLTGDWGASYTVSLDARKPVEDLPEEQLSSANGPQPYLLAPQTSSPTRHQVTVSLLSRNGTVIFESHYFLNVFPNHQPVQVAVSVLGDPPSYLRNAFATSAGSTLLIAAKWSDTVAAQLNAGGNVILLADSADALPANFPIQLKAREGSNYNGDWISNFNWILPSSPVFQGIAFNRIMGFEGQEVTPNYVLLGVKPEQFDDVLAGAFYGWIHNNSGLMLQTKYGKGKLLITTLRFDQYGKDPYATTLLDNILRYVSSPQFAPKLDLGSH